MAAYPQLVHNAATVQTILMSKRCMSRPAMGENTTSDKYTIVM